MSVTVIVSLTVADFDGWKTTFDAHEPARVAAGIHAKAYKNRDDEKNAVAFGTAPSKDVFVAFFTTPEMQEIQKNAGVVAPPEIKFLAEA